MSLDFEKVRRSLLREDAGAKESANFSLRTLLEAKMKTKPVMKKTMSLYSTMKMKVKMKKVAPAEPAKVLKGMTLQPAQKRKMLQKKRKRRK